MKHQVKMLIQVERARVEKSMVSLGICDLDEVDSKPRYREDRG